MTQNEEDAAINALNLRAQVMANEFAALFNANGMRPCVAGNLALLILASRLYVLTRPAPTLDEFTALCRSVYEHTQNHSDLIHEAALKGATHGKA